MAINPKIKQKAEDIRKKIFGAEVRESLASGLEGMSEDVESIKGRQGNVEEQFQDVLDETTDKDFNSAPEIKAARGGHDNLSQRLLSTDQQLQHKTNLKNTRIEVISNEMTDEDNIVHIYSNAGSDSRTLEIHTRSGVTDGSINDKTKARESLVIHHYNDNNNVQIDNVGRDNAMVILKQGTNPVMASHSEIGRGSYIEFDRAGNDLPTPLVVEHLGRISPEDWWDVGMIAPKHTWGLTLVGKRSSANKVQTTLPVLIYSKGISADYKGEDALRIHSTDYGGTGLRITNRPTSYGSLLHLIPATNITGQPTININQSGANSAIGIYNNGQTATMFRFSRANATFGHLIEATNESGATIFRIEGDGLAIHLKDSATGELKRLAISNGSVVVQ